MRSILPNGKYPQSTLEESLNSWQHRHPKIIEDEKAIEVVLRLEEDPALADSAEGMGRRLTVTAVGSHMDADLREASIVSAGAIAEAEITKPGATQQRRSSSIRRASGVASFAIQSDHCHAPHHGHDKSESTGDFLCKLEPIDEILPGLNNNKKKDQAG